MKHIHHIVPRHMGGTDDPSNLIELSVEEHAEAHKKLYEKYGCEYDRIAWLGLAGIIGKEEIVKKVISEANKGKTPWNKGAKGVQKNPYLAELNRSRRGQPISDEAKVKVSAANKGRKRSEEFCEAQSKRLKGKRQSEKQAEQSRKNAIGNKSRMGQKRGAEELKKTSETLKSKYASGEMIHWTKRPEHAHRFKKKTE